MGRRAAAVILLGIVSLAILLFPWGGFYRSPLMWATWEGQKDAPVDVFLIGATSDLGDDGTFQTSCFMPEDRYFQDSLLNMQEAFYRDAGRIYAPYYRQACLSVYYLPDPDRGPYFAKAYQDVRNAFLWYLERENEGRPFILAGFSQGADLGLRLMEEFFDDETLQDRLVAAYLIGWRVTEEDLSQHPQLKMAQGELDTGVIVSFNSEAPGITDSIIVPAGGYTYGINPLNWKTDGTPADKNENRGFVVLHMDGSVTEDTREPTGGYRSESRGTMIVPDASTEDFPSKQPLFVEGCYHDYELVLYFHNVHDNVQARVDAYLSQHKAA